MGNTNFQTIHQMGTAISNMVKQATGRDDVQNIDMEHITVAQNHRYEEIDLSGQVVSFRAGEAGLPFEKMVVQIKPVQSGSGDPSPDNIRPITGWTMVNVYQAGQNMEDARVFRFTFPSEAGIVYSGTLDVIIGELVVDMAEVDLGTLTWKINNTEAHIYMCDPPNMKQVVQPPYENRQTGAICSIYPPSEIFVISDKMDDKAWLRTGIQFFVRDMSYDSVASFQSAMSGVQLVYELATPLTYQLTPQEITTLLSQNYIWADTGDIEVKFTNVKEMY